MNRSRVLLVLAVVLASAVGQLSGAERAGAPLSLAFNDISAGLTGVSPSSVAWGDYNSDGYPDILLTGQTSSGYVSKIYKNNGGTSFSEDTTAESGLIGVAGSAAWGDYNSDNKPDILLTGFSSSGHVSKIYKNNGDGSFSEIPFSAGAGLTGVVYGSVAWGDYNSDGKPDILLAGAVSDTNLIAKIYRNNGDGTFTDIGAGLSGVRDGSVAWGDYNSDGKPDILITGNDSANPIVINRIAKIYRNNGNGTFTEDTTADAGLTGVMYSSVAWGDYNSDGKPDILLTGSTDFAYLSKIYRNNGDGTFTAIAAGLIGVDYSSVAWGDYNLDGRPDILLTGRTGGSPAYVSRIYKNNGVTGFSEDTTADAGLTTAVWVGSVAWGDYNDGKLDILLAGLTGSSSRIAGVYRNDTATSAFALPTAPGSLSASFAFGVENLSWAAASDSTTPTTALTYNLRVGTTPAGSEIVSPMSIVGGFLFDGKRLLFQDGNVGARTSYRLTGLAAGTYYWSVQAVDAGFAGSHFASEGTFIVPESFAFSSAGYSVGEGDGTVTVTINRAGSTVGPASVHFASADGTATAGADYTAVDQTVSFAAGETTKTVSVPVIDDSLVEGNETVQLSLTNASADATLGSPSSATLTIVDNDRAFALSSASYSVGEAGGSATVTINRAGLTSGSDSVHFATANGTATAGSDYTDASQTVSFAAGETSKTVSVPIIDDSLVEGSETVLLSLSSPSSGATLGSPSSATLTIVDNDKAFAFSSATYSVGEAGGHVTVTINRTGLTSGADSVHFATANGTAKAGSDYTSVSQTVSFAAGETSKTVSVPIINNTIHEPSETAQLSLSGPSAGATLGSPHTATLTIRDDDNGKIVSAFLSKTSFKSSEAGKVKLTYRFAPRSTSFAYLLSVKKGLKWVKVRSTRRTGSFRGSHTMTVKRLFGSKPVKRGSYRLKLSANMNSKLLGFRVR
jgi:hypothetical protein